MRETDEVKVLVTGGAGFLGSRLARVLLDRGQIGGRSVREMVLADMASPAADLLSDPRVRFHQGFLAEAAAALSREAFDVVFHLAAAVSGECEADFDLGLRANIDSTRGLLEALRAAGNRPRLIFASSVAVFGNDPGLPMPPVIRDNTLPTPQSSYGTQKFICEQLVADYSRKGFLEGRSARLMTVVVRPGQPNAAASGFLSSIIREPLHGQFAVCPVAPETAVALASPTLTMRGLIAAAEAQAEAFGGRVALNLPALTIRVGEMLDALEQVAGRAARERVRFEHDPVIHRFVESWPAVFENARAARLGLTPDPDFPSIIRQFIREDLSLSGT